MLAGSAIGGAAVAVNLITKEIVENRDKLETYLAHGATRHEACLPLICEALKVALLPTLNQMRVYHSFYYAVADDYKQERRRFDLHPGNDDRQAYELL
jgi:hypothetical protein